MADTGQIAQATALEVAVTVQGSKTVEGTDQRELFTESTKTILVSEHGAVLKLNARISPGQCVFLRNDQSGKEILCKVVESRQAGETGYTDLEFTVSEPKFWDVPAEQPAIPTQKLEAPKEIKVAAVSPAAIEIMNSAEPAPTSEEIPTTFSETANAAPASGLPESPEGALPKLPNRADGKNAKDPISDWDEEKDAQLMAVLAAMDGKSKPQRTAPKEPKDAAQPAAAAGAQESKAASKAASEASTASSSASAIRNMREWGARQNPVHVGIAAAVLVAVALGLIWRANSGSSPRKINPPPAVTAQPAPQPVAAPPSQTLAAAAAAAVNNVPSPSAQQGQKIPSSTGTPSSNDSATLGSEPTAIDPEPAPTATEHAVHRKAEEPSEAKTIPAKIVSQTQPSLPPWATGLDADPVVQVEVSIDEKGNVVETKAVSGPRLLQASAQRAVGIWIFEPALSDGKPIASHMVVTVEFQKTPEGTN
jgi:hypothetical protein